jgi:steroid 5-alpha reductase family enzyme
MIESFGAMLTGGLVLALLLFVVTWLVSVRLNNYSLVDVTWALSFAPMALFYGVAGDGWGWRRWLVCALVVAWSLRLGGYLWRRVVGHLPAEDARYAVLREKWSANMKRAFFWFFMAQALLVWLLMLPVAWLVRQADPGWYALEWMGYALWVLALVGEGVADYQLAGFKAGRWGSGSLCEVGLWKYSRHPNYFFQSLLWWGLFLMALPFPYGWLTIVAPLAMLHFLLNVTGIPLTEKLAVDKRGDVYRDYQRRVSAFVPWKRR